MTNLELEIVSLLADAYGKFTTLPAANPQEALNFSQAITHAQNIIMSREGQRAHPDLFGPIVEDKITFEVNLGSSSTPNEKRKK